MRIYTKKIHEQKIYSTIVHNKQQLETAQMLTNNREDKLWYSCSKKQMNELKDFMMIYVEQKLQHIKTDSAWFI